MGHAYQGSRGLSNLGLPTTFLNLAIHGAKLVPQGGRLFDDGSGEDTVRVREGRRRVVIEGVQPELDGGRFPVKRVLGERVVVEADVFADGHDAVAAELRFRTEDQAAWRDVRMAFLENDRWRGAFPVSELGWYRYTLRAWIDRFGTWRRDLQKKALAGQDVSVDLLAGEQLVGTAARSATREDALELRAWAKRLHGDPWAAVEAALHPALLALMDRYPDRRLSTSYGKQLVVVVDRQKARFGTWYEMFPRSCSAEPGRHGTFADAEERLKYVAGMDFDVIYLPPIHPIGHTQRKGKNNTRRPEPDDPGSPWAIGSEEGGHKAVHPQLGTIEDFEHFVARAEEHGMEVALDLAYQCSPDHPLVKEHPEWFRHRPDGTIQYAENPPKKYEDIYPLDFETEAWPQLWEELKTIVLFWIGHGVRIFRVDNPHTKPFRLWEWLIEEVKAEHPDVIFLAEAFTRPKVMYRLAKLGFTQSYTYFAWRTAKWELEQYFTELTKTDVAQFFRPNLWPNTPDILTEQLQTGGRPAFMQRLVLAATLGASYGIYGPAFEHQESQPLEEGSEEYLDSEKYEIRYWELERSESLADFIGRVNRIRKENPALQSDRSLRFHRIENDELIAYSKCTEDRSNVVLTVVNLNPRLTQEGWLELDLDALGVDPDQNFQVHDLLTDLRHVWQGSRNFVRLDPSVVPAQMFRIRGRVRTEHDFESFM
jgi:starch synthase (maltosyl-transferring)